MSCEVTGTAGLPIICVDNVVERVIVRIQRGDGLALGKVEMTTGEAKVLKDGLAEAIKAAEAEKF